MTCKYCYKPITTLLNAEMQCFACFNKQRLAKPARHQHKITLPKWEYEGVE